MRMIFGVMSLLIVLAIVGTVGKKQLQALGQIGTTTTRVLTDPAGKAVGDAVMGRSHDGAATVAVPGAHGRHGQCGAGALSKRRCRCRRRQSRTTCATRPTPHCKKVSTAITMRSRDRYPPDRRA